MDNKFELKKNNYQPNSLTLSRQEWGVNERKILSLIINQLDFNREYDPEKSHIFRIPISEVSKHVDYKYIREALNNLQSCKIQAFDKLKDSFSSVVLFPEYYYNRNNSGKVELVVTNASLTFLLNLDKDYTKYNLDMFLKFQSVFSQRMYEIVMMELKNNHRKVFEYDLDFLQNIFDTKYNNFANFKLRVLDKAKKDIFEKADLVLNYEPSRKKGKKVESIKFTIQTTTDVKFTAVDEELNAFRNANPKQVSIVAYDILSREYKFSTEQQFMILNKPDLLEKFVEINAKIDNGLIKIRSSKTHYLAKSLGFGKS